MDERIRNLRKKSIDAIEEISSERAELLTAFHKENENSIDSIPIMRAKAFHYILSHKYIYIDPDEWIVGERGEAPKKTPTYPEICLHSIDDLKTLNDREKVSFKSSEDLRKVYEKTIIPYWKNKTIRDRIFAKMTDKWKSAYEAGVFTEFLEQRAPGHTVLGGKIYKKGMKDIIFDINSSREKIDHKRDKRSKEKIEELKAMEITADALMVYAKRHAERLEHLAEKENDRVKKEELLYKASICRKVPGNAPETFHEALQYYWFVHIGVITELNPWDSFNPGRLDQHLYPFYINDINEGRLNKEKARELLQSFWIKFNNHPAPPKIGITAKESNTYTDFCLINLGGITKEGKDGVNELTYLILDIIGEMRLLQPSSMVQISKKNPNCLIKKTLKIIKTGFGQPSLFNTEAIIQQMLIQGKTIEDARTGGASGCVETGAFGKECYILSGYFNLAKILEITLNNGIDPINNKKIGTNSGNISQFKTFDDLIKAYEKQLQYFADIKIKGNNEIAKIYSQYMPAPFLSILIDDCIENAMDYNNGGARYNTTYIQGVGIGSTTDSLTALKFHVFDKNNLSLKDYKNILDKNFDQEEEFRYELIYNTPKYGNDDDYADEIIGMVFEIFHNAVNNKPSSRGGVHRINLLPTTSHVYFGSVIKALPDGRKAYAPLSEGISPVQGADTNGPTAVIKSASKIDHLRTGGTLLNQKFSPSFFKSAESEEKLMYLIRTYFKLDGHHIQFNIVSADILRKAQKTPEQYRDLIVRVAGYSDYFNDLGKELQDEIIRRTEHYC